MRRCARVGRALLYQQFGDLPVNVRLKRATRRRCFGLPDEHIWLQSKIKLKINHWRSSPGPPELAGFYVDSVTSASSSRGSGVVRATASIDGAGNVSIQSLDVDGSSVAGSVRGGSGGKNDVIIDV